MTYPTGGTRDYLVRCYECGSAAQLPAYRCDTCGGPLVAELMKPSAAAPPRSGQLGIWRYAALLPRTTNGVSLGEGATPLVPVRALGNHVRVLAKLESVNPTLSFKDRAMALGAASARDYHAAGLVLASSGNAAASAAAYAAAAGLPCQVFAGRDSHAEGKLAAARAHGAAVTVVEADYSAAYARATCLESQGWWNVTTTYRNPLLAEAYRTIAFELYEELGTSPDVIVIPVGAGPLLRGVLEGFRDLTTLHGAAFPRLVGVQAAACAPLARAWLAGSWTEALTAPTVPEQTCAAAIADPLRGYEREGLLTLDAIKESRGTVIDVSEDIIIRATETLAKDMGLLVEPAAACALAALADARLAGSLTAGSTAILILTGHGAKDLTAALPHGTANDEGSA